MRNGRGDRELFADELADLTIMLEQLCLIYDVNDLVCEHMDLKAIRLQHRIGVPVSVDQFLLLERRESDEKS